MKKILFTITLILIGVFSLAFFNFKKVNATGGSQSETWIINENPSVVLNGSLISFTITFTSNNTEYLKINATIDYSGPVYYLSYYESTVPTQVYNGTWVDEAYRTITFDTAPTGSLLTWLQANAVKVVETIPVESIEIGFSGGKLLLGQTYQINPTVLPENATDKTVIYYSNDTEVATVSASGLITAVGVGTATITASAGGKSDTVVFTVYSSVADTYSAGYDDGYGEGYYDGFEKGLSQTFKAVVLDSDIMTWDNLPVIMADNVVKITSSKIYIRDDGLQGIAIDLNMIDDFIRNLHIENYNVSRGIAVNSQFSFVEVDNSSQRVIIGSDLVIDHYMTNVNENSYYRIQLAIPIVNSAQTLEQREAQRNKIRSLMNKLLIRDEIVAGFIYRKGAETNVDDFLGLFDAYYKKGEQEGIIHGYNNAKNEFGYNHNGTMITGKSAYNLGYQKGLAENPDNNFGTMIRTVLLGVGSILSVELLPHITIGAIIAVPIIFGIISFVLGRRKD